MADQIKREIAVMKMVRHPHVVRLIEVMASQSKIYMVLELAAGGQLFDRIVHRGRLSESEARRYFQQLVDAVDYCHAKGVCHRDLKPENMLLDERGNLKVSDFGLSALPQQQHRDGLLHTTCGTPNYVAPEVRPSAPVVHRFSRTPRPVLFATTLTTPRVSHPHLLISCPAYPLSPYPLSPAHPLLSCSPPPLLLTPSSPAHPLLSCSPPPLLLTPSSPAHPLLSCSPPPLLLIPSSPAHPLLSCSPPPLLLIPSSPAHPLLSCSPPPLLLIPSSPAHPLLSCSSPPLLLTPSSPAHPLLSCSPPPLLLIPSSPAHPLLSCSSSPSHQVLCDKGYDGRLADVWSCGVILFVLLAGYAPFQDSDLRPLYRKIRHALFSFPACISPSARALISAILQPDPAKVRRMCALHAWGSEGGRGAGCEGHGSERGDGGRAEGGGMKEGGVGAAAAGESPELMNAFDLIARAHALDLGALFHRRADPVLRQTRFASRLPPALIRSRLLALAPALHADAHAKLYKIRFCRPARNKGRELTVVIQIFEMTPGVFMVEARKDVGDTLEYHKFYRALLACVSDMVCHDGTPTLHPSIAPPLATPPLVPATLPISPPDHATCRSAPSPGVFGKPGVLQEAKPGVARDEAAQLMRPQQAQSAHRRASLDEGQVATIQACRSGDGERGRRRSMDDASQPVADLAARAAAAAAVAEAARRDDEAFKSPAKARTLDFWPGSLMSSVLQSPLFRARPSATGSPASPSCNPVDNDPPALSLTHMHSFSCSCSGSMCHCRAALSCSADRSAGGDGRGEGGGDTEAVQMQQVM
ncbi:unnamed protein product [Closterium sp. Naga37s-1]|nr:unnamed protein product [Closterium sp. Naga37s-1]